MKLVFNFTPCRGRVQYGAAVGVAERGALNRGGVVLLPRLAAGKRLRPAVAAIWPGIAQLRREVASC
ncbi:hypothetical protein SAMN02745857_02793 [Andreprevotia lacus DSM 23236]|jgi:hypothetical protein|uniref:Uncharacterized protein n=1 Tax=Andreprevotia lacus DSM 23236 TaxID=1121001 RepID=A0A1W1XTW5_9NEIS|nr:hypothetical protein [Andreprevotia lacus]SMC27295.1 hypothetical protein SAMN02745857_02793 [Andreprevotia lacus DSM 23236]